MATPIENSPSSAVSVTPGETAEDLSSTPVIKGSLEGGRLKFEWMNDGQKSAVSVAAKLPLQNSGQELSMAEKLKEKFLYVKVKVMDDKGKTQDVLVNVSSLAKQLGISSVEILGGAIAGKLTKSLTKEEDKKLLEPYEDQLQGLANAMKLPSDKTLRKALLVALKTMPREGVALTTVKTKDGGESFALLKSSEGLRLTRLQTLSNLGAGGYGTVTKVASLFIPTITNNPQVMMDVVKLSKTDDPTYLETAQRSLQVESDTISEFQKNPQITHLQKAPYKVIRFQENGQTQVLYIAPFYAGGSADQALRPGRMLSGDNKTQQIVNNLPGLIRTLDEIMKTHVHLDIKPENLLVDWTGKRDEVRIVLSDLGGATPLADVIRSCEEQKKAPQIPFTSTYFPHTFAEDIKGCYEAASIAYSMYGNALKTGRNVELYKNRYDNNIKNLKGLYMKAQKLALGATICEMITGKSALQFNTKDFKGNIFERPIGVDPNFEAELKEKNCPPYVILQLKEMLNFDCSTLQPIWS